MERKSKQSRKSQKEVSHGRRNCGVFQAKKG
jgi:hypothetical protein